MKLSYAITVCNEEKEVQELIRFLYSTKRQEDEIVVLLDKPKASANLIDQLYRFSSANWITLRESTFQGHFADWKNELTSMCKGDYIFQIDADEMPTEVMMKQIPMIIEKNPIDLIRVARVNTVDGLTDEHIVKWGWQVNRNGWVNYPDYQWRIYKNSSDIKWTGRVHESITGHSTFAMLPLEETDLALRHHKTIDRQEKQNTYYSTL